MRKAWEVRGRYWLVYYLTYAICVVYLLWRHDFKQLHDLSLFADSFTVSAGTAVFLAVAVEVTGFMVLLIPDRIRKLKRQGRKEQRDRNREAYKRFGVDMNGVRVLPLTPEVEEFLASDEPLEEQ